MPFPGTGLLTEDPLFVSPVLLDFTLSDDSPCIDAGSPEIFDPDGTVSDIGAIPTVQIIIPSGDCNDDGILNVLDIIGIINDCILCTDGDNCPDCACADINMDDDVNVLDVVLLVNTILYGA